VFGVISGKNAFFKQACCESRTESMQEERIAYVHSIFLEAGSSQDFGF